MEKAFQELIQAAKEAMRTVHNGSYHQWTDWNDCDRSPCPGNRAAISAAEKALDDNTALRLAGELADDVLATKYIGHRKARELKKELGG